MNMKRIFKHLFMLCLFGMISIGAKAYGEYDFSAVNSDGQTIYYKITSTTNFTCEVTRDYSNKYSGVVNIPSSVTYNNNNYTVTSIGNSAFSYCQNLTKVTIPNTINSIGESAFSGCDKLTEFALTASVKTIGKSAFSNCTQLTSIEGANCVTTIGDGAFDYCSKLTSSPIGQWVETIGENAFYHCDALTNVNLSNNVHTIKFHAFNHCYGLTSVTIPSSVTSIGNNPFYNCINLANITVEKGNPKYHSDSNSSAIIETSTNTLISGCKNTIIPTYVKTIGEDAFALLSTLTSITIPTSVTEIGVRAFAYTGLTSINIPNSVKTIKESAFNNCNELREVTLPNSIKEIAYGLFMDCKKVEKLNIPNSVTSIGNSAFKSCGGYYSWLTWDPDIPSSVTSIGDDAFRGTGDVTLNSIPTWESGTFKFVDRIKLKLNDSEHPFVASDADYSDEMDVTYSRTLAADTWGTIVLPFVPDASSLAKVKLYALSSASSGVVRFKEVEADAVQAGVPYLFKNVSGQDDFTLTASKTTITTNLVEQTPVNGMMLQGVYQQQKFTGDDTVYGISGNKFLTTTGTMTINPFHAYLKSVASGAKEILIDDEIDGIEDIKNFTPALSQGEGVNLQGIHVGKGYNGIVIINGKKYLNK